MELTLYGNWKVRLEGNPLLRVQLTCNVQMLQVTQQELQKRLETIQL